MTRNKIELTIGLILLPFIIMWIAIFFAHLDVSWLKLRHCNTYTFELLLLVVIFLIIYLLIPGVIYKKERALNEEHKWFNYRNFVWWWPKTFINRYMNVGWYVNLAYASLITSLIFIISLGSITCWVKKKINDPLFTVGHDSLINSHYVPAVLRDIFKQNGICFSATAKKNPKGNEKWEIADVSAVCDVSYDQNKLSVSSGKQKFDIDGYYLKFLTDEYIDDAVIRRFRDEGIDLSNDSKRKTFFNEKGEITKIEIRNGSEDFVLKPCQQGMEVRHKIIAANAEDEYKFLYNGGIIVVFVFSVFAIWTFLITNSIRLMNGREIKTLDEIHNTLARELKEDNFRHQRGKFIYIYDYSPATGHKSGQDSFTTYKEDMKDLFFKKADELNFKVIMLERDTLKNSYMKDFSITSDVAGADILTAHDVFLHNLNQFAIAKGNFKILFKPFILADINDESRIYKSDSERKVASDELTDMNDLYKERIRDLKAIISEPIFRKHLKNENLVLYTRELGLTRYIISNNFVIQFLAYHTDGNGHNAPIGYLFTDLLAIGRYKSAYDNHFISLLRGTYDPDDLWAYETQTVEKEAGT